MGRKLAVMCVRVFALLLSGWLWMGVSPSAAEQSPEWPDLFSVGPDLLAGDGPLRDNLRWALDLSSQIDASTDSGETSSQNIAGLDLHKVFSGDRGDWGTLTFQLYMTRFDN